MNELADFIGVKREKVNQVADKLNLINEWAIKEGGSNKMTDVFSKVKSLKKELGIQTRGTEAVKTMYEFIRLDLDGKRAGKGEKR